MTPAEEKELFARIAGHRFESWLDEEMAATVKYLMSAADPSMIGRAQGKALFIEDMRKLIAAAKK